MVDDIKQSLFQEKIVFVDCAWAQIQAHQLIFQIQVKKSEELIFSMVKIEVKNGCTKLPPAWGYYERPEKFSLSHF